MVLKVNNVSGWTLDGICFGTLFLCSFGLILPKLSVSFIIVVLCCHFPSIYHFISSIRYTPTIHPVLESYDTARRFPLCYSPSERESPFRCRICCRKQPWFQKYTPLPGWSGWFWFSSGCSSFLCGILCRSLSGFPQRHTPFRFYVLFYYIHKQLSHFHIQ